MDWLYTKLVECGTLELMGLCGVGKTRLALGLCHRFSSVLYIDTEGSVYFHQEMKNVHYVRCTNLLSFIAIIYQIRHATPAFDFVVIDTIAGALFGTTNEHRTRRIADIVQELQSLKCCLLLLQPVHVRMGSLQPVPLGWPWACAGWTSILVQRDRDGNRYLHEWTEIEADKKLIYFEITE